jgi:hypothetical protein
VSWAVIAQRDVLKVSRMRFVVAEPTFVSHLLDGRQPLWILQSTVQGLSTLSTCTCCECGAESSNCVIDEDASSVLLVPPRDSRDRKIPLLERLSYMLVETVARQKEVCPTPYEGCSRLTPSKATFAANSHSHRLHTALAIFS